LGLSIDTSPNAVIFSSSTKDLSSNAIKFETVISNGSYPIDEISKISDSSSLDTKNLNVPSSVELVPIFFLLIPMEAYGMG
jgi:hypothetical protein